MAESPEKKLERFYAQYSELRYKKGETIVHAYDVPPGVFYLKKGYVRVYSISEDGKELTFIIFKPGDCFPITWALGALPNAYYVEAMTPVTVFRVPRDKLKEFMKQNPDVFYELTVNILVRLRGLMTRMEHMAFADAYKKVSSIISICAERFGRKERQNIIIQVPLTHTHQDVASLIGLTRETTSIEMKKLENKKLVGRRGTFIIVRNPARLKREAKLT